jgi:hypothetical protein
MKIRFGPSTFLIEPPEAHRTLNGWNIPLINHVKDLGVIFDKRIAWRLHIEMIEAKAFRAFIRIFFLFKIECLSAYVKLTVHKALIRSVMNLCLPHLGITSTCQTRFSTLLQIFQDAHSFQPSICIRLYNKTEEATSRGHSTS